MAGGSAIRGSRVGAGPMGEAERGDAAPRLYVSYFCAHGHETRPAFAADATIPEAWDCPRCGLPANLDSLNPPPPPKIEPYKTHLAYVKERRSDQEAADILTEALQALARPPRPRRGHLLILGALLAPVALSVLASSSLFAKRGPCFAHRSSDRQPSAPPMLEERRTGIESVAA